MTFAVNKLNNQQRIQLHHQRDKLVSLACCMPKRRDLASTMSTSSKKKNHPNKPSNPYSINATQNSKTIDPVTKIGFEKNKFRVREETMVFDF